MQTYPVARGLTLGPSTKKTCKIDVSFQIKSGGCFDSSYYSVGMNIDSYHISRNFGGTNIWRFV